MRPGRTEPQRESFGISEIVPKALLEPSVASMRVRIPHLLLLHGVTMDQLFITDSVSLLLSQGQGTEQAL